MEEKAPGLLLQAVPYLGQQKILKVFTPHLGVISLIAKGSKPASLLSPFCLAEWVYRKGRRDLYVFVDGSISDSLLDLRSRYASLCSAGQIARDLLQKHLPGSSCPELFALASSIFQKISLFEYPDILVILFRLKWLHQEGLLSLSPTCSLCGSAASHLSGGESYCKMHADISALAFSLEEWCYLLALLQARTFSELKRFPPNASLSEKITHLFEQRMNL